MASLRDNKGFSLLAVVITLAIIPSLILILVQLNSYFKSSQRYMMSSQSKQSMLMVRNYLIANSSDPDNDSWHELYKENAGNTLPLSAPMNPNDQWGTAYRYCTWDLGSANGNTSYSQNNTAPPKTGMIGKLVSAGADKTFQTACSDVNVNGEDLVLEMYEADARSATGALSGWTNGSGVISQITTTDVVKIGTTATDTNEKLHIVTTNGGLLVDSGATSNSTYPAQKLTSSGAGWGSGIQMTNTGGSGRNYGLYAGSDGVWHFADVTAGSDRLTISSTGTVNMTGSLSTNGLANTGLATSSGATPGTYGFTYAP